MTYKDALDRGYKGSRNSWKLLQKRLNAKRIPHETFLQGKPK